MNIDVYDQITLSDDQIYLVVGKADYLQKTYYFLVNKKDYKKVKFCEENKNNHSVIEVNDQQLKQELFPLFLESFKNSSIDKILEDMEK